METMGPMSYARKYWNLNIPILNDNNEIERYEKVDFNKYRLHQGWGQTPPIFPPGQMEFVNAVNNYSYNLYKQGKRLQVNVMNIWGSATILAPDNYNDGLYRTIIERAARAFSGKGSPEDVQLTLQLAARCGVAAKGLQQYCDEKVDVYSRLGLDCNGFVGNYLCYRNSTFQWHYSTIATKPLFHGELLIGDMCNKLAAKAVSNVQEMQIPRTYVLALVARNGVVIEGGWADVGHIMITQPHHWGFNDARPPMPEKYFGGQYLLYSGVEANPNFGLSDFKYTILEINKDGVGTIWRDKMFDGLPVRIYPVP